MLTFKVEIPSFKIPYYCFESTFDHISNHEFLSFNSNKNKNKNKKEIKRKNHLISFEKIIFSPEKRIFCSVPFIIIFILYH